MNDTISRAVAQTELQLSARRYTVAHEAHGEGRVVWSEDLISVSDAMNVLRKLPSAEEESFEWCTDCKEYDQEKHCCHRFSKMIRKAVDEMRIVHCIDCQHSEYDSVYGERWCHYNGKAEVVDDYHFCRDGERREDE